MYMLTDLYTMYFWIGLPVEAGVTEVNNQLAKDYLCRKSDSHLRGRARTKW